MSKVIIQVNSSGEFWFRDWFFLNFHHLANRFGATETDL